MQKPLLNTVYEKIDEYLKSTPKERLLITWHGGEPCMAGKDFYYHALECENKLCSNTKNRIDYQIQSNLTLIDDDFIDILKKMRIHHIGTSFETLPDIRGIGKKRDSHLYNKLFFRGLNILEKHNISWGIIYVVTKAALQRPLDIFYHLTNLSLPGNIIFHPVSISRQSAQESRYSAITPREYVDFLGTIFKEWWPQRNRFPHVEPFSQYYKAYTGQKYSMPCEFSHDCGKHVYIGPTGKLSLCGRSGDRNLFSFGNIADRTLVDIFNEEIRFKLKARANNLKKNDCNGCKYFRLCYGGCPLDTENITSAINEKSKQCEVVTLFLSEYFEPITHLILK